MGAQDLYVVYTPCRWWGLPKPQRVNTLKNCEVTTASKPKSN